jgi:hypothetical protein
MLLVIFGAGASFDSFADQAPPASGRSEDYRLPLANELFSNRKIFRDALLEFEEC